MSQYFDSIEHLSECPCPTGEEDIWYCCSECNPDVIPPWERACICDIIRTVEQRVDEHWKRLWDSYAAGLWEDTLDAALESVAALEGNPDLEIDWDRDYVADPTGNTRNARIWLRDAVNAIEILREKNND